MCLSRWCIGGVSVSYVLIFMSATSENNKRIAKNTLFLYMRMLLIMGGDAVHQPGRATSIGGRGFRDL